MMTAAFIIMELHVHPSAQAGIKQYRFLQYFHIYQGMCLPSAIFIGKFLLDFAISCYSLRMPLYASLTGL
jgi:hypothetical protein